ncbi:MAG: hypothetical protein ACYTG0_04635 [Planctomycetota bacterium]|jgi:YHS domain-containing protein
MKVFLLASLSLLVATGVTLVGCSNQQQSASPEASQSQPAAAGQEGHEGHEHDQPGHAEHSEYAEELSQLSATDRALAEKQKACPVSGQPLGSMGKPYKVTVNGREVFLCCQGCEGEIKGNPDEYLAKLPK